MQNRDSFFHSLLFDADDLDIIQTRSQLFMMDDNRQEPLDDFELDLEMNDLLDEFGPDEDAEVEIDIFADAAGIEGDNKNHNCADATQCACKKKRVPQHDYAMDSTFISLH